MPHSPYAAGSPDDALPPPAWRCDFCGQSPPVWVYPSRTFTAYEIHASDPSDPPLTGQSGGAWLACADCRTLIERIRPGSVADHERLYRRCATIIAHTLHLSQQEILPQVRAHQEEFFTHQLGPGRPWTPEEAAELPPPPIQYTPPVIGEPK